MSLEKQNFGTLSDGQPVDVYILKNAGGMTAEILTFGCRLARLCVPDRAGKPENMVLGHDTLTEYERPNDVLGAVVGRYANRIAGAEFRIGEKTYHLVKNDGSNSLHSAPGGFQNRVWRLLRSDGGDAPSVTFSYSSPDGECGFPGNAEVTVTYTLTSDDALKIDYRAVADAETPVNLTNHSYFNITGSAEKDILSVEMQLNADSVTEVTPDLIPTGRLLPVAGTPYDFREPKPIGKEIDAPDALLRSCGGYDHNYVLSGGRTMKKAGELYDPASGRRMAVFTDLPGIQVYSGNSFAEGALGNGGVKLKAHHAVCLETQFYPDSVNRPEFPYENLMPGKQFATTTIYKFSAE